MGGVPCFESRALEGRERGVTSSPRSARARRGSALGLALALVAAFAVPASADVRTEARRHFRRGMDLVTRGQLEAGILELEVAYRTLPHPNVLYNIGRAYAEAGRYSEAIEHFERYLESDPPDRVEVLSFLEALRARLPATPAAGPPTSAEPPDEPRDPGVSPVDTEEIRALEETATQLAVLAEAAQSALLRDRASRLRGLADLWRERQAAVARASVDDTGSTESGPDIASAGGGAVGSVTQGTVGGTDRGTVDGAGGGVVDGAAGGTVDGGSDQAADGVGLGQQRLDLFEEEVVSASRFAESPLDAPNSTQTITRQDIRLSGLTDLAQLLRRVAGVEVMTHYASHTEVGIRGLSQRQSNKVLWLIDGRTVRLDFLGAPWSQMLPVSVDDIERIEVIRGPAAAVYGADAFSGIINIITRDPGEADRYVRAGGGSRRTATATASMSGRSGPFSARVSGGYLRTDPFVQPVGPDRVDYGVAPVYDDPLTGHERTFFNVDARADLGPVSIHAGTAIAFGQGSIQGVSRLREVPVGQFTFAQSHLTVSSDVGLGLRVYWNRMTAAADGVWESPPGGLDTFGAVNRQDVIDTELNFNRRFELGVPHNISIGVGHRYKGVDWDWADAEQTEQHFFGYLQDALQLHERLRFTASLRVDRHPLLDGVQLSPRGALVWRFLDGHSLRFTGGTAFRSPAFLESYLDTENRTPLRAVTAEGTGNINLNPERIISFEVGYMNQATDYFALEANLYYNLVLDQIVLASVNPYELSDFGRGRAGYDERLAAFSAGELQWINEDATIRQLGGEVGVRLFPVTGLDIYANYAIHDTSPSDGSDFAENPARARDQRTSMHKINVGLQYRSPFGLDVNVDLHWVSDQLWVEQVTDTLRGVRFEEFPLDGYVMIDARLGWRFFDDHLELGVTGTNLTFQRTRQHPLSQPVDTRLVGDVVVRF